MLFPQSCIQGPSRSRSYGSWIYNYLCNQCLSLLKLWVQHRSWRGVLDTILCDKVCQWLATGRWFSPGTPVSSTNKTDRHDITEILLKVALNSINHKPITYRSQTDYSKTQRTKYVFVKYVNQYTRYIFLMKKKPSNLENTLKKMYG